MKTKTQVNQRLDWYIGKYIDFDGMYGMQCADLVVDYCYWLTGIRLWGNARDLINNNFKGTADIHENTPDFIAKKGDVAIYTRGSFDNQYGHTSIVYEDGNKSSFVCIEQNWDGRANTPVMKRKDDYSGVSHFIRFKIAADPKGTAKTDIELAREVIAGKHGSGAERKKKLGSRYNAVQFQVNNILTGKNNKKPKKTELQIAREVIRGNWSNGQTRDKLLRQAGYNPASIQRIVNDLLR